MSNFPCMWRYDFSGHGCMMILSFIRDANLCKEKVEAMKLKSTVVMMVMMIICGAVPVFAASQQAPFMVTNEMIYEKLLSIDKRLTVLEVQFAEFKESTDRRFEDMNKRFEDMNKRFEDMNKRFEDMNKRFEEMRLDMNKRFEEMRLDMNKRFEQLYTFLWIITGIFTTIMISVLGLAYWDRRTIIRQAKAETVEYLESEGKIKLIIEVLKERARKDAELATILRQFNML